MKSVNTKSLMVVTILFISIIATPMVVMGAYVNDDNEINQFGGIGGIGGDVGIFEGFQGGFGGLFGENLGYGGNILGSVFEMLFLQGLNLSAHEKLESVFVLSANRTHRIQGEIHRFNNEREIVIAPPEYNRAVDYIGQQNGTNYGYAYCEIIKNGSISYEIEVGAAVTLVIWDHDKSFITAVNKLINFFKKIMEYQREQREVPEEIISDGISLLTWFLIHINDIFTGDELFVLNPITWQRLEIIPLQGFNLTKTWKVTGDDYSVDYDDELLEDLPNGSLVLEHWHNVSDKWNDNRMQWLLTPTLGEVLETIWTQFSFDLIQLWVKNFHIEIDVGELLSAAQGGDSDGDGPDATIANAFDGCDIEFYLFTHHLAGAFLYNDSNKDDNLSVEYIPIEINGTEYERPYSTEISHRLILGTVNGGFNFKEPTINKGNKSISWGLNIEDVNISAVPIGVDLYSYLDAKQENLDYIYFGFTFEPSRDNQLNALHAMVKLDQFFAPWNDPELYGAKTEIGDLDLAIIYVSTVLHFHLNIQTQGKIPEDPETILKEEHFKNETHELKIGNYLGKKAREELDFVDIIGYDYEYGSDSDRETAPAIASTIPVALWTGEMEQHDSVTVQGGEEVDTFSSDIMVQAEFNVLVYAVCYPEFNDGSGIWHDPTFSVYMVFEAQEFWALIILLVGVGLVGVATILIKRYKDRKF